MKTPLQFKSLPKLKQGDKVAIVSPSFAAPGKWPHIYELGLRRLREDFGLVPVAYPATSKIGASKQERSNDLIAAFSDPEIKAVIASLGGNDQVTYVKTLPGTLFGENPKPYFGYSDNSHFMNHLWLNGVPSFYGGALFTQFAETPEMQPFTVQYLRKALFEGGEVKLKASEIFNDIGVDWNDPANMSVPKRFEPSDGWHWGGSGDGEGYTWGGCLESIDEMLRHGVPIPTLEQFEQVVLMTETSEEMPDNEVVRRLYRALGERGILERVQAVLVGRPKTWEFGKERTDEQRAIHKSSQRETILKVVREYNQNIPIVQSMDFGHTEPNICIPYGGLVKVSAADKTITAHF